MKEVLIDSYIPVDNNDLPVMAKSHGPELWVIILEKAYAKLHGNYFNIQNIVWRAEDALFDLTGAPYLQI